MKSEYILSKKMPWSDGIKSMAEIELRTHKGVGALLCFPHQGQRSPPPVQLTSWGHIKPGFSNG